MKPNITNLENFLSLRVPDVRVVLLATHHATGYCIKCPLSLSDLASFCPSADLAPTLRQSLRRWSRSDLLVFSLSLRLVCLFRSQWVKYSPCLPRHLWMVSTTKHGIYWHVQPLLLLTGLYTTMHGSPVAFLRHRRLMYVPLPAFITLNLITLRTGFQCLASLDYLI